MPLSDREQQLLEQMERALIEEDPRFATSMRGGPGQARNRRRLAVGVGGVLVGLGVILLGVTTKLVVVGALGFALMVAAVVYAVTERRTPLKAVPTPGQPQRPAPRSRKKSAGSGSFMSRLEQRWEQRRDEGHF
jgi:membrane-associated phospholipid phosphatase